MEYSWKAVEIGSGVNIRLSGRLKEIRGSLKSNYFTVIDN